MTKGKFETTFTNGKRCRFVREPGGGVRYWVDDNWQLFLERSTWNKIVKAMGNDGEGIPHDIVTGEIEAWRCWEYSGGYLKAMYHDVIWAPKTVAAGHVGEDNGSGGLYAFKDKGRALSLLSKADSPAFLGRVALWGDVVEHENGYRAECAKIISLDVASDPKAAEMLPQIREQYGIEGDGIESMLRKERCKSQLRKWVRCAAAIVVVVCAVANGIFAYAALNPKPPRSVDRVLYFSDGTRSGTLTVTPSVPSCFLVTDGGMSHVCLMLEQ